MLKNIVIKGAKEHNLKNVSLTIPKEIKKKGRTKLTVPIEKYQNQCSPKGSILIPLIQQ